MNKDRFQYGYDRDGNVLYKNNLGPSGTSGAPSTTAAEFSELYHANSATSGDDNTSYDALGRLTAMRRGTLSASTNNGTVLDTVNTLNPIVGVTGNQKAWTLNAVGGWSSVTTDGTATSHTTNAQNETTAVGTTGLTYDNNGNLTKNDQGYTLKYDAWNRIVSTTDGSGYTFTYDALGTNTFYYDNQNQLIEEYVTGVYSQFVFGLAYVNEVILRDSDAGSGTNAYGLAGSGLKTRIYDQQDANWNTTSLDQTGGGSTGIIERLIYDAYGTPKTLTSAWASYNDTGIYWRFLFQGEYWLAETNTYIMGARNFDYTIGSWDQKDPIGYLAGTNVYDAFAGNPVTMKDPTGFCAEPCAPEELAVQNARTAQMNASTNFINAGIKFGTAQGTLNAALSSVNNAEAGRITTAGALTMNLAIPERWLYLPFPIGASITADINEEVALSNLKSASAAENQAAIAYGVANNALLKADRALATAQAALAACKAKSKN